VHPDKNTDPNSERAFRVISDALHVLTDPEMKNKYDAMMAGQNTTKILLAMGLYNNFKKFF